MIQILKRVKPEHRKIQYASLKVPLEPWLEGWLRKSTIFPQVYVWIEAKERSTGVKNVENQLGEYTHNNTGLGAGKIQPQGYSMRLLEGPTRTMAGRSAQTVNNLPEYVRIDQGKGAEHKRKQYRE